ncbi:MAG: DUF4446 family protein [bacterium]|nr:DUF4446 family protein [bacterium]
MQTLALLFLAVLAIWLLGVSIAVYRIFALFNKLSQGVEVTDLKKVLEKILSDEARNGSGIKILEKRILLIEEDNKSHVQKIGLIRFNPFKELGGDHSFCLAILDGTDTGVVITGLHTRERTRVYMKEIKKGTSVSDLSLEEKKAVTIAQKNK